MISPDMHSALILLAMVFAIFAAVRPQPFLSHVHPGWLAMALFFAAFFVR